MSAATKNLDARRSAGDVVNYGGASGYHIYAGTLIMGTSEGYVRPFAEGDTQSWFAGVAVDEANSSSQDSGALDCRAYIRGTFTMDANGTPAQSHVGYIAYAVDDNTVGTSSTQAQGVGTIVGYDSANTTYRISIDNFVGRMKGGSGWHESFYQGSPSTP